MYLSCIRSNEPVATGEILNKISGQVPSYSNVKNERRPSNKLHVTDHSLFQLYSLLDSMLIISRISNEDYTLIQGNFSETSCFLNAGSNFRIQNEWNLREKRKCKLILNEVRTTSRLEFRSGPAYWSIAGRASLWQQSPDSLSVAFCSSYHLSSYSRQLYLAHVMGSFPRLTCLNCSRISVAS